MSLSFTSLDLARLQALVDGQASGASTPGIRDFAGAGNNLSNTSYGAGGSAFVRLSDARYGSPWFGADPQAPSLQPLNRDINPLFKGLDPRAISEAVGVQASGLAKQGDGANMFFTAFSQFVEHGFSLLAKGGHGSLEIGAIGTDPTPGIDNPADLTRGTVASFDVQGVPVYLNEIPAFAEQNQVYGSHVLVATFLRQPDAAGGITARLAMGAVDPSDEAFRLLPTLRELILAHWTNDTLFDDGVTAVRFRSAYAGLVDSAGNIDADLAAALNINFMGSGRALLTVVNPVVNLLDHFVAGDPRVNENLGLMAMHTLWARNHNHHVENLADQGFTSDARDLFEAARILNEAEYQQVVFREFADALLGGLRGDGLDGRGGYQSTIDPGISLEFAAAASRIGHTLFVQQVEVCDAQGNVLQLPLYSAFLNPGGGGESQPGYAELGVDGILEGFLSQAAEEVDAHVVDGARTDLVHTGIDLYALDLARGRDLGVGSLNQIRRALLASDDPYVMEAVGHAGDLSPYSSWADFKTRNGLSDELLASFESAYPDLVLPDQTAIDAFVAANPDIPLHNGNVVRGIERVDLIVGGLAEAHLDKAMVGQTFWVILHEQFDRLQEADRYHYADRLVGTGIMGQLRAGPEAGLAAIVARNTGLEVTPGPFFLASGGGGGGGSAPDIVAPVVASFAPAADATEVSRAANLVLTFSEAILRGTGTLEIRRVSDGHVVERFDVATSNRIAIADRVLTVDPVVTLAGGTSYEIRVGAGAVKDVAGNLIAPIAGHVFSTEYVFVGSGRGDALNGTSHADTLRGLAGNDFLEGRGGHDLLEGGSGADFMRGGSGNDTYLVDSTSDRVAEVRGEGFDTVKTSLSTYFLRPHVEGLEYTGNASFRGLGNALDNRIRGGNGADRLEGGDGADTLCGGDGSDVLIGGSGKDILVFDTAPANGIVDRISGFSATRDRVHLDSDAFSGLGSPGPLASAAFVQGAAATSAVHRLIFNPATSVLAYDPDGVGGSAPIVFATVEGLTGTLTAAAFVII